MAYLLLNMIKFLINFTVISIVIISLLFANWLLIFPINEVAAESLPVTYVNSSAIVISNGADVTVTLPTHQANDILIAVVWVKDVDDTITWPAGWTEVSTTDRGTLDRAWVAYKRAASSSEPNPLIDKSTTTGATRAVVHNFRGAITVGNPFDTAWSTATGTTDPATTPQITTVSSDAHIVFIWTGEVNASATGGTVTATSPTSLTKRSYQENPSGGFGKGVWSADKAATGATGNFTHDITDTTNSFHTFVNALKSGILLSTASVDTAWVKGNSVGKNFVFTVNNSASSTTAIQWVRFTRPSGNYTLTAGSATGWSTTVVNSKVTFTGSSIAINSSATFTVTADIASIDEVQTNWIVDVDDQASGASLTIATESSTDALKTGIDNTAPANVGMSSVTANSSTQLTATALTATDSSSGLHAQAYWFEETSNLSGGSDSTSWQTSTSWVDTGLSASTQYCYRVKVRDAVLNESGFSTTSCQTTQAAADPISSTSSVDTAWVKGNSVGKNFVFTVNNGASSTAAIQWVKFTRPTSNYTLTAGSATGWSATNTSSTVTFTGSSIAINSSANFTVTGDIASVDEARTAWTVSPDDNASGASPTTATESSTDALKTGIDKSNPSNVGMSSVTANSNTQLTATALTATDSSSGLHAQAYWFEETSNLSGGSDSTSWQTSTSWVDTGLLASTQYCYRVKVRDAVLNESGFSTTSCQTTQATEATAPAAVTNLATSSPTSTSIVLTWTAPGDDGNTGTATSYDVRYYTSTITNPIWNSSAIQATGEPAPLVAGSATSFTVTGLSASTTYYFALKTSDEVPNTSDLSNVPSGTTTAAVETTAPAAITNLATSSPTSTSIVLTWTAPGDDGNTGTATSYDVRYSTSTITDANWASATQATGEPAPLVAGSATSFTVTGLSASTTYYFALKTSDEVPNTSDLSNVPSGTTTAAADPISATSSVDTAWVKGGSLGKNFIFTVNNGSSSTAAIQWVKMTRPSANYTLTAGSATGWSATVTASTVTFTGGSIAINSSATFTVTADIASVDEVQTNWTVDADDQASGASPVNAPASSANALKTGIDNTAPANVGISSVTANSDTQLTATALTATDASSGLHSQTYWFDETSANSGGSDSTSWQSSTSWVDTGLLASTQYCYRVKARDAVLNESGFSTTSCQTTQAAADTTVPAAVTNLATSSPTNTSIVLTWTAPGDDASTGTATTYDVRYSTSTITDANWASATQATGEPAPLVAGSSQSMTITGLSASTTYYFALKTSDEAPNTSGLSNVASGTTSATPDTTPPVISSVSATSITSTSATITWTTDENADSQADYGLTTSYGSQTTLDASLVTSHSVSLTGLTASTLYHYRVKSKDAAANLATSGDFTFTTASPPPANVDTTAPSISNVQSVNITSSGATITWTTDKIATSQVEYSTTTSAEFVSPEFSTLTTSHSVTLSELKRNTLYNYRAKSKNSYGYHSVSSLLTFTTLVGDITPPTITDVKIATVSHNSITVGWTTNEAADSQIEYGETEKYGSLTDLDKNLVTSHSVTVSGLKAETLYHYRVISKDANGNETKSSGLSITTNPPPDTAGPILSDIKVVSLRQSTAKITWKTNEPATSKIIFGDQKNSYPKETLEFATLILDHEINLGDLESATTYYYKVKSRDAFGNETISPELNFKTESLDIITEISVAKPDAALIGSTGTTISKLVAGEIVTEVPILATEGDQEPPVVTILPFKENPTENTSPIIAGEAADRQGVIASLSYSTDNGLTWHPVKEVKGIGAKKTSFTAQPIHLNDGNYSILVRARDNSANIGYSKPETLIIDALPPATGGNVILIGTQALIPNAFGLINTMSGITQRMVVSAIGGAIEVKLIASLVHHSHGVEEADIVFPLTFSKATNLWFGDIIFQKPGIYNFEVVAIDGAGKISQRPINPFKVFESGKIINKKNNQPLAGVEISLWQFDETVKQWLLWPGEVYNQANPQMTGEDGAYRFLAPPGKYYLKAKETGIRTFYSRILELKEHQAINMDIAAASRPIFTFRLPIFGEKNLAINLPDFFSAKRTVLPQTFAIEEIEYVKSLIDKPAPIFSLPDTSGETIDIRYQRGKKLILTTWTTWSPLAQSQIPLLDELVKEDQEVKVVLLSIQESGGIADVYLRRGGYSIPSVIDREGELLKLYPILTFPQHFIIDRKGIIRDIHIGFLKKDELEEKLNNL